MGKKSTNRPYHRNAASNKRSYRKKHVSSRSSKKKDHKRQYQRNKETKFMPCNSTNIQIIKDYFETISSTLYNRLANSGAYQLFQFEGNSYEIYLVPVEISRIVKKFTKNLPITHAGIHLGYMRRKRTHTGFVRAFYLSYEGGEFLYHIVQTQFEDLKSDIQIVQLNGHGEKSFLYGHNIDFNDVLTETKQLQKKNLIFVINERNEYIGLALLLVKQAGAVNLEAKDSKYQHDYSRSPNFTVALINLTDAGYFLRKGK